MPNPTDLSLTFARPNALWLLAALPLFALLGWLGVRRRRLPRAALGLRLLVVALVALGLAEPLLTTDAAAASTVFLVDRSRSLDDGTAGSAAEWVADALAAAGSDDQAAVVTFGAAPRLAAPVGRAQDLDDDWSRGDAGGEADRDYTDVEAALALARALPLGGARRIVLVSDGAENVGAALDQAAQAAAEGVPVDVVPLDGVGDRDLRVEGATAPSSAWLGEPVTVLASVSSGVAGPGRVELWVDGQLAETKETELPAGLSSHAFTLTELPAGFHGLEVRVAGPTEGDRFPQNNTAPLALVVRDQPRLLLIAPEDADAGLLAGALAGSGAEVEPVAPGAVPSRLSELGEYDGFVLDNVPLTDLSLDQVIGLREAARGLGRGLVVVGGTSSYGPGAYAQSPLEEALPVTVRVTDGTQRQKVALLLIVDKSGSMSYDPLGGAGKIEMAKEAVRLAAGSLVEGDQIGVIVFNDRQEWAVPLTPIEGEASRRRIDAQVNAITADGGTEILPALSGRPRCHPQRRGRRPPHRPPLRRQGPLRHPRELPATARRRDDRPHHPVLDRDRRGRRPRSAQLPGRRGGRQLPLHGAGRRHPPDHPPGSPERRQPVGDPGGVPPDPDPAQPDPGPLPAGRAARPRRLRLRRGEAGRPGRPHQRPRRPDPRQVAVRPRPGRCLDGGRRRRPRRAVGALATL